jgi:hypothetical protein
VTRQIDTQSLVRYLSACPADRARRTLRAALAIELRYGLVPLGLHAVPCGGAHRLVVTTSFDAFNPHGSHILRPALKTTTLKH